MAFLIREDSTSRSVNVSDDRTHKRKSQVITVYEQQKDRLFGVIVRVCKVRLSRPVTIFIRLGRSAVIYIALSLFVSRRGNIDAEQVLGYALTV